MDFELLLLGTGSAFPRPERFSSAQVLSVHHRLFLMDCGEGAQVRMQEYGVKAHRIEAVFISHLHGDHYLGLPGLLDSFALQKRSRELKVFAPPGLEPFLEAHWQNSGVQLPYHLDLHTVDTSAYQSIFKNDLVEVWSLPLKHRQPCSGYLIKELPRSPNILPDAIQQYGLTVDMIKKLKDGNSIRLADGRMITPDQATRPSPSPRSYAYCSDTAFLPELANWIRGVDLLYHEATFGQAEANLAPATMHSTARQAAEVARAAQAGRLVMGHFSSRYDKTDALVEQAKAVFPNTVAGEDGMRLRVPEHQRETPN